MLAYLDGPGADLSFRRGWTHGVPALLVLPLLLTGAMLLLDRGVRRLNHAVLPSAVRPGQVLFLSAVAVLTHPILDTLNTYGVRWLMPFSGEWFYGDTLFIVDPWMWLILGLGVALSRQARGSRAHATAAGRPARIALAAASAYVLVMAVSGMAARRIARRELESIGGQPVQRLMVGPRLATPFVRDVVAVEGASYQVGTFRWFRRPHVDPASLRSFPRPHPDEAGLVAAAGTELGRRFLRWARFPLVRVERRDGAPTVVHLIDLRYADHAGAGFGTVSIPIVSPPASGPP